jgi:DNA repair ATPase RecN
MKLSAALKEKNKLTKKITETQKLINQHNSVIKGNQRPIDAVAKLKELEELTDKLVHIKSAIAAANQPINRHILHIGELRSQIAFLRNLDTKEGNHTDYGSTMTEYETQVKQAEVLAAIESKENEIEKLQEIIDQYNHSTEVTL